MVPPRGGVNEICSHLCRGKTTDGSKEDTLAHLKLPEFPKDDDKRVPPPPSDPKAVSLTLAYSASRREVPDILSWITCFGIYASDKSPEKVKQLLAYQTLIVCEACRCGDKG